MRYRTDRVQSSESVEHDGQNPAGGLTMGVMFGVLFWCAIIAFGLLIVL